MSSLNQVNLIGRVGGDPEVNYLPNGNAVCNITLATSEQWKDKQSGEKKERTEWHRVVFFGKLAEIVGEYVGKGSLLYVSGALRTREWEKDGVKRYTTEIVVDMNGTMKMLGSKPEGQGGGQPRQAAPRTQQQPAPRQQQAPAQAAPAPGGYGPDSFDEDIPFN